MTFDDYHAALCTWWAEVYLDRQALPPAPADSQEFQRWWERGWSPSFVCHFLAPRLPQILEKYRGRLPVRYLTPILAEAWRLLDELLRPGWSSAAERWPLQKEGGGAQSQPRSSPAPGVYVDVGGEYLLALDLYPTLEAAVEAQLEAGAGAQQWNELARQWMAEREEGDLQDEEQDPYHSGPADGGRSLCLEMR